MSSPGRDQVVDEQDNYQFPSNKKGFGYAIAALLYEVLVCLIYGLLFGYSDLLTEYENTGNLFLVSIMTIFAIVGLGLINSYITNASFSGMALTLLIFALTIQHYFMMRAFWDKAGANDPTAMKQWGVKQYQRITLINSEKDRGQTYEYISASLVDAIACAISMIVAFSSLVGRIQPFQIFFMTLFGAFFYEVNNQLMWNIYITDMGYGMRVFLFGAAMGIISSCILGRKQTTLGHHQYRSVYSSRSLGLVGLVIAFCTFPMLIIAELYQTSDNYNYIMYSALINMWFALGAGILGSFSATALMNGKIFLHDLVYSGLSGGIAYSSSCDLHKNPAVPLTVGFVVSFLCTAFHSRMLRSLNKSGVKSSLGHINMYLLPGFFSGALSGILHGINQGTTGSYIMRADPSRTFIQQGGFQIIGILLSLAIGIFAGAVIGIIFRIINNQSYGQQFNDNAIYSLDRKDELKYQQTYDNE